MQIPVISPLIHYFKVFYGYAGKKLFVLCFIILLGGISEGFGISMLLPILDYEQPESSQNTYTTTLYQFLERIGIGVSLFSLLALLIIAFSFKGIFTFAQTTLSLYITTNLTKTLKVEFCHKYEEMKYSYYTNTSIGYLNNIITTETERAVSGLSKYIDVIINIIFVFIYVLSAFVINWKMTVLVLVICLFMFAVLRKLSRMGRRLSVLVSETNSQIQSLLIQTISNFKYLKASNSFGHLFKQLHKRIDENLNYQFKNGVLKAIPTSLLEPVTVLFLSGLILYHVGYNNKTIAEIFVLLIFFYKAFSRIFSFQIVWQKFNSNIGGVEVVKKAAKDLGFNKELVGTVKLKQFEEKIELKDINFSYGAKQVLFNINIIIPKNKSIGIVGESGSGKTTIFDIITGLINPQSGSIVFDGMNYKDIEITSLRRLVGYVTQEPVNFNDTIANNISFWEGDYEDERDKKIIESASDSSNSTDFIQNTESGFQSIIGDKGIKLSGGQRQRISIAREIYRNPEIMIFDEATSSLDTESEAFIQRSIKNMMGKRTIVIIAHRLSTIKNCDYVYVLSKGKVIEEGCFDDLYLDSCSRLHKMCKAQDL